MKNYKILLVAALAAVLMTGCGSKSVAEKPKPDYSNIKVNIPEKEAKKPDHITFDTEVVESASLVDNIGNCPLVYNPDDGFLHMGSYDGAVLDSREEMAYEGNGNTLTLKGFNYITSFSPALILEKDTKIVLADESSNSLLLESNTVPANSDYNAVIYALYDLDIEGTGNIFVTYPESTEDVCAVRVRGDLNVTGVQFYPYSATTTSGTSKAVVTDGDFNISSSSVSVVASDSLDSCGISCENLNISDSTLTVLGGSSFNSDDEESDSKKELLSAGIIASKDINSSNSIVSVDSSNSKDNSVAISAEGNISVAGGSFSGVAGVAKKSIGIKSGKDISINNAYTSGRAAQANVFAYGIYAGGDVTIDGNTSESCVTAEGGFTFEVEGAVSNAMYVNGKYTQNGSLAMLSASTSADSIGLQANGGLDFNGGSLSSFGFNSLVVCKDGVITIADGTDLFGNDNEFKNGETKSLWSESRTAAFFNKEV